MTNKSIKPLEIKTSKLFNLDFFNNGKTEMETHPVIVEAKTRNCAV